MDTVEARRRRLDEIQVYGVYPADTLIYIGATRQPLQRRLSYIRNQSKRVSTVAMNYMAQHRDELKIRQLDYGTEQDALDALGHSTLNQQHATPVPERSVRLPDELLMEVGTDTDSALARRYDVSLHKVRDARAKLGIEPYVRPGHNTSTSTIEEALPERISNVLYITL